MPIEFDKTPGSAKGAPPEVRVVAPGPGAMRVRMLRALASKLGRFKPGDAVVLPADTARSWIGYGFAEQDKMVDAAPETKTAKKRG